VITTTLNDLSDHGNVIQARHELHRCTSLDEFAYWAKKWGDPALDALEEVDDAAFVLAQSELERIETELDQLRSVISGCVTGLGRITAKLEDAAITEKIDAIVEHLEAAL
jgi:hypothetical protein